MIDTKQWVVLLNQQYTTVSNKAGLDLLLATRKFVDYLESDPQPQRYVKEINNVWEMNIKEWFSNCHEIRRELQNLQHIIREVGVQIQKHIDGAHEILDQNEFDRSEHILGRITEVDWYKPWDNQTDDLNLALLHIERPEKTQTGYMVSHVLVVSQS